MAYDNGMRVACACVIVAAMVSVADAKPKRDPAALVLVLDRSGSMQGPKLDAAKQAALAAVDALAPGDQIAIVAFDSDVSVVVPLQPASHRTEIGKLIGKIEPGGGTNIYPGLEAAFDLLGTSKLKIRHVILMTDGEAPYDGITDLLEKMQAQHITVSAVGVAGADRNLLQLISEGGNGRLYMVDDIKALAKIFAKEISGLK